MTDHDQRFKILVRVFFAEFVALFFPEWAARFDFGQIEWLEQEVFLDPPQGEHRRLDLVAKVRVRQAVAGQRPGESESWVVLVHIEIESPDKVAPLRSRMHTYYETLRQRHGLPVLPIGLYLRVGLDGVGWDVYEEHFWERRLLRFEYAYIGMPALDGAYYTTSTNILGAALAALMRLPEERKAELRAEALRRIAVSGENDYRKFLLVECVDAYWTLTPEQTVVFDRLTQQSAFQEVMPMMMTTYERGVQQGIEKAQRETLQMQLETRFGPLSRVMRQRLESLPADRLHELLQKIVSASTLQEVGLEA